MPAARPDDPLFDLLRRVRRRMRRVCEARAVVAATLAVAATLIVGTLIGQDVFALVPTAIVVWICAVGAMLMRRSPSDHDIAAHIDRERQLHELLASSLSTANADDPASVSLRAMAREAAAQVNADEVRLDRPSERSVIAAMLVFVAAVLVNTLIVPPKPRSVTSNASAPAATIRQPSSSMPAASASDDAATATSQSRQDDASSENASKIAASTTDAETASRNPSATTPQSSDGTAAGRTDDASHAALNFDASNAASASEAASSAAARAGRASSVAGESTTPASAEGVVDRPPLATSPAWIAGDGSNNAAITAALANGSVPARCRDLVRAYFDASGSK